MYFTKPSRTRLIVLCFCLLFGFTISVLLLYQGNLEQITLDWDQWRYANYPDGKTYAKLLHIRNGDSISKLTALFGTPVIHSGIAMPFTRSEDYPDGVQRDDVFLEFCCVQPGSIWLQTREGKLVNYNPERFRNLLDYK